MHKHERGNVWTFLRRTYQRSRAEPQANPPPMASSSSKSPFLTRPSCTATHSASGIDAAEVLPCKSTVSTTFCGAICNLCAEASMIRLWLVADVRTQMRRQNASVRRLAGLLLPIKHDGAGAIAEQHAGAAVIPV